MGLLSSQVKQHEEMSFPWPEAGLKRVHGSTISTVPSGYNNFDFCYLQGREVPSHVVRNQLALHLATYAKFTALKITNLQVFLVCTRRRVEVCLKTFTLAFNIRPTVFEVGF